jgi:hypothetical protein
MPDISIHRLDQRPELPMPGYLALLRDDGLPADPWLRVHVRAGRRILRTALASMVMVGSLAQWRDWTGLPFDQTGDVVVPCRSSRCTVTSSTTTPSTSSRTSGSNTA